ncbi:MAG: hypothetical protein E7658_03700 [Ruminococcaceae bacterium]|nr:hypothetical protein [Oscillospiraceae bacterium]
MRQRRVMIVLICILAAAICIVAVNLIVLHHKVNTIPEQAVTDLCAALAEDGIALDPELVSRKKTDGIIYMGSGDSYGENVAVLLCGSPIRSSYVIPDGILFEHRNGRVTEFMSDFSFRYRAVGVNWTLTEDFVYDTFTAGMRGLDTDGEYAKIAAKFLERGDSAFEGGPTAPQAGIRVEAVRQAEDGIVYVRCVRLMDGMEINGNEVICVIRGETVTEAAGEWCFLTFGEAWQAQLSDITNILFTMKRDIRDITGDAQEIRIRDVSRCYSLYFLSGDDGFCLIPCVKISAEPYGILVYNALNGTLYTTISEK